MTTVYRPFPPLRRAEVLALLQRPVAGIAGLAELRALLTKTPAPLAALHTIAKREEGFEARFTARILPSLVGHARALLENGLAEIDLHVMGERARTSVSRADAAGWVAHMVLGTVPQAAPHHPHVDFVLLLERTRSADLARLRCVLEYFDRIADEAPPGRLEFERIVAAARDEEDWSEDTSPLTDFVIEPVGVIEDAQGHRQMDFANKYLGGGVLTHGCVQEEIRFAVCPELFVGMIVSPRMLDHEAIVLRGAERFAKTRGYAGSLRYDGPYHDPAPRFEDGTPDVELVAVDALDFRANKGNTLDQFSEAGMLRELNKARSGWRLDARALPVATGNWGCGAFLGDIPLKAILQWIAASAERRLVRYYSFGDERLGDLGAYLGPLRARYKTAGRLWDGLRAAVKRKDGTLYERLMSA